MNQIAHDHLRLVGHCQAALYQAGWCAAERKTTLVDDVIWQVSAQRGSLKTICNAPSQVLAWTGVLAEARRCAAQPPRCN